MLTFLLRNPIVIRIEFPALDNLVTYLNSNQQKQLDALAAQLIELKNQLKQSGSTLEDAIEKTP